MTELEMHCYISTQMALAIRTVPGGRRVEVRASGFNTNTYICRVRKGPRGQVLRKRAAPIMHAWKKSAPSSPELGPKCTGAAKGSDDNMSLTAHERG
jgi:hypothetical protein